MTGATPRARQFRIAIIALSMVALGSVLSAARADIFEWEYVDPADPSQGKRESTTLVPGGAGVNATPWTDLASRNLTKAYLIGKDLTYASFQNATLTSADLTGAEIHRANFVGTTYRGFTAAQLYATASYQGHDLAGLQLNFNDLSGWDFAGQNLTDASLHFSRLTGADLTGADVRGADFTNMDEINASQLYSTASYQARDLTGLSLSANNLSGWDFAGQNLANVSFWGASLSGADFAGAEVRGANFNFTTSGGLEASQIYSTASYQARDLTRINFNANDLSGWDFAGQNLAHASFYGAKLAGVNFAGAEVRGVDFRVTTNYGFTAAQLYGTASYQARDLSGIVLVDNDLSGWDLSGQNLANAGFALTTLIDADLTGADTRGATSLDIPASATTDNLIRPDGRVFGLDLAAGERLVVRDYDGDQAIGASPIPVQVADHFAIANGGVLRIVFEANAWDSTISFAAGVPVNLGGVLELAFADDVDLASQIGRTFQLLDWAGVTPFGMFDEVQSDYVWDLSQLYSSGDVTLVAVPEPSAAVLMALTIAGSPWRQRRE